VWLVLEALTVDKTSYPIVDFLEWQRQGGLDLNPPYQRRQVWNPLIKSKLIDSLLRGYPLPLIFLHNRVDIKQSKVIRQVVDGQQRLRTILSFIDIESLPRADEWDKFTVSKSHNERYYGLPFDQLPEDVQTRILQTPLSVNVLPANVNDVTVLQIFQRMNSTGLKLNPQELRNATYFGEFKDLSYSLAYDQLHRWLAWDLFDRQKIGQMLEVEFTADLMGLLLKGVFARTKSAIVGLYRDYEQSLPAAHEITQQFNAAFDFLDHVFSPGRSGTDEASLFISYFEIIAQALAETSETAANAKLTPERLFRHTDKPPSGQYECVECQHQKAHVEGVKLGRCPHCSYAQACPHCGNDKVVEWRRML
jgi:hypothetical protein